MFARWCPPSPEQSLNKTLFKSANTTSVKHAQGPIQEVFKYNHCLFYKKFFQFRKVVQKIMPVFSLD